VSVAREGDAFKVTENGQSQYFAIPSVSGNQIFFWGYDGNDTFVNSTGLRTNAYGMNGNDVLVGGYIADQLHGGEGDDELQGGDGPDMLIGEGATTACTAARTTTPCTAARATTTSTANRTTTG
jgi:Ca2+-binding RTX toxin-like protein